MGVLGVGLSMPYIVHGAETMTSSQAEAALEELAEAHEALRVFALEGLVGRRYDEFETKAGKIYKDAVVKGAAGRTVEIGYFDEGLERVTTLDVAEGPSEWVVLVPSGKPAMRSLGATDGKLVPPGDEVAEAIVVIEGDAGVGTGFLAESGGKLYLYTAAHVLSGNKKLTVKLRSGRRITQFGKFEASGGADLVRIEVEEEFEAPLQIADTSGRSKQGMPVFAAGNSGGGGTVGFLEGRIQGVGAESIEIDAGVIQGNSGGPIIDGVTHEVLGVVTHLVAARKDQWAKETRFSEIRRFGCRVDRRWNWDELPIGMFLREGQQIKELTDLNNLMVLALQPEQWESPELREYESHRVVKEIRALQGWFKERGQSSTGVSASDHKKKIASFFSGLRTSSKQQMRDFKPERFVWFHREMAEQVVILREEIDKTCDDAINNLR